MVPGTIPRTIRLARVPRRKKRTLKHTKFIPFGLRVEEIRERANCEHR